MNARARHWLHIAAVALAEAVLIGGSGLPAHAQFPDLQSHAECPGCAAQFAALPIEGTWSTPLTAAGDAGWSLEDFACVTACTTEGRARAAALFVDPRSAARPSAELLPELDALGFRSLRFGCDKLGFAEQVVSPLPLSIRREGEAIVLRYEEGGAVRTVPVRFEGGALVVETLAGGSHATERYAVSADGRWLNLTLELADDALHTNPRVLTKRWLRTSTARIAAHGCDVMSSGLELTLADYVDPRRLDERRAALAAEQPLLTRAQ